MSLVEIRARNYSGSYEGLNGAHEIKVSRRAILWAILTVGFQDFGDLRATSARAWIRRVSKGVCALCVLNKGKDALALDEGFEDLDGSEKTSESYALGMIFSKIVASRLLGIHWLAHVDGMIKRGLIHQNSASSERGDLVGLCPEKKWHVVEAKGRSSPYPQSLVQKAKNQAANISAIGGVAPATTSACIISLWTDPISVILDDPPADYGEKWDLDVNGFWHYYYKSLAWYVQANEGPIQAVKKKGRQLPIEEGIAASIEPPASFTMKDRDFAFAPLAPLLELFPEALSNALAPLPTYVGLPREILADPGASSDFTEIAKTKGFRVNHDGVVLLGPFN